MKNLELNQMENLQGGLECGTGIGLALAGLVGGFLLVASGPVGWGAALYFGSAAGLWGNGVYNCGAE
jgi:hypothetical protein